MAPSALEGFDELRRQGNHCTIHILLRHAEIQNTVRYLGFTLEMISYADHLQIEHCASTDYEACKRRYIEKRDGRRMPPSLRGSTELVSRQNIQGVQSSAAPNEEAGGRNLTSRIVHDLGRAIVTEKFSTSTPFPFESVLAEQYGASRSVLREAVKMLTAKGLLRARQRAGTEVLPESSWNLLDPDVLSWMLQRDFSIDLLIDFTEVRMSIEPRAAGLAADTATGAQRRAILQASDRMFAAERGEDDALEADIAFHSAVLEASNNRFMRQFTDLSEATLRFSIRRTNEYKGVSRASAIDHRRVADAIAQGESLNAAKLMYNLIQGALDLLMKAGGHPRRPSLRI